MDLFIKNGLLFDPAFGPDAVQRKHIHVKDGVIAGFPDVGLRSFVSAKEASARLKREHRSVYERAEEIYPYFKEAYFRCHQDFKKTSEGPIPIFP